MDDIRKVHLGPAKCAVDLSDGSERGEYVDQDYILNRLGRPHRSINLMYCYYPLDELWPARISEAMKDADVKSAWGYPYDDYFTYKGGLGGNTDDEPFTFMRDVRRHGQDVTLTLTVDPHVSDEHLIAIAKDLRPFGRLLLRINHEATGNWFSFNKRATYQEVADFYVRFHNIIKEHAPNVKTILCIGGIENSTDGTIEKEKEFSEAVRATDIWSVDKYMALHWGWPYDIAEAGGTSHGRSAVREVYEKTKQSYERFRFINGGSDKPMVMSELNADGDVTGAFEQTEMMTLFCDILDEDNADWLSAFTFYQFRDRGRLGLETEDPNNRNVGIEQPVMKTYRELIRRERFLPRIDEQEAVSLPVKMRWGGAEDADGVSIPLHFDKNPVFCEVTFNGSENLIMELNGRWFYKSPAAKTIDLMSAFYDKPLSGAADLTLKIFAPPASGENDPLQGEGWQTDYYSELSELPDIRIRFEPPIASKDK